VQDAKLNSSRVEINTIEFVIVLRRLLLIMDESRESELKRVSNGNNDVGWNKNDETESRGFILLLVGSWYYNKGTRNKPFFIMISKKSQERETEDDLATLVVLVEGNNNNPFKTLFSFIITWRFQVRIITSCRLGAYETNPKSKVSP